MFQNTLFGRTRSFISYFTAKSPVIRRFSTLLSIDLNLVLLHILFINAPVLIFKVLGVGLPFVSIRQPTSVSSSF